MSAAAALAAAPFEPGALIDLVTREVSGIVTRPVVFLEAVGVTRAHVKFGDETLAVEMSELQNRAGPASVPDYLRPPADFKPNWFLHPPRHPPIEPLRDRLRQAQEHVARLDEAVTTAKDRADKADATLRDARLVLARHTEADRAAAEAVAAALAKGHTPTAPDTTPLAERDAAKRYHIAVEDAATSLTGALATARSAAREAHAQIHAAARAVIVAIAEREAEALVELEIDVANRRAELRALAVFRPANAAGSPGSEITLPFALLDLLRNPVHREATASQPGWASLYESLVGGEVDADLEPPLSVPG